MEKNCLFKGHTWYNLNIFKCVCGCGFKAIYSFSSRRERSAWTYEILYDKDCFWQYMLRIACQVGGRVKRSRIFFLKLIACLLVDNITFYLAYYHDLKKVKCKQIVSKPDGKWKGFGRYSWSTQRDHVSMLTTGCNQLDTGKTRETSTYRWPLKKSERRVATSNKTFSYL